MSYKLLIVDDERNMCRSLEILLENEENYKTQSAYSAEDALKVVEKDEIDLVITDLTMPGMSGISQLQRVEISWVTIPVGR